MVFKKLLGTKSPKAQREDAKRLFEKVAALDPAPTINRKAKIRQALLLRNHVDQTFVETCKKIETYEILALAKMREGGKTDEIPQPEPTEYQSIKSGDKSIMVYAPEEFAGKIFRIAAKYQRAELSRGDAIDLTQKQYDELCEKTIGVVNDINVLGFLREED